MNFTLYSSVKNVEENIPEVKAKICDPGLFAKKTILHFREIAFENNINHGSFAIIFL
jgi:hypothetical protein